MTTNFNADLKLLIDQINDMEDSIKTLKESTDMLFYDMLQVTKESVEKIKSIDNSEIDNITEETIDTIIVFEDNVDIQKRANDYEKSVFQYKLDTIKEVKTSLADIDNFEDELAERKEEKEKLMTDYYEYIKSPEYKAKRQERIDAIKKQLETETDDKKIKKLKSTINMYESLNTLSFLFTRLIGDKQDKEIGSIIDSFFESARGTYVMNKFRDKCKKIGINPAFYSNCLNIEDKFLAEEYAPFNNLFIFIVIRFIAYIDVSNIEDKTYATRLVMNTLRLFTHDFDSNEDELAFVEIIKRMDDYFMQYTEEFKKRNITYREHPVRIEHEKQYEEMKQKMETNDEEVESHPNVIS